MSIYDSKQPQDKENYVGIELEFYAPIEQDKLATLLTKARLGKYLHLKDDGSIEIPDKYEAPVYGDIQCSSCKESWGAEEFNYCGRCGTELNKKSFHYSHELCVLVKQSQVARVLPRVTKILNDVKAKTNSSCGLHVHLDMRNRDPNLAFANLVVAQPLLYNLVKADRKKNEFCQKVSPGQTFSSMSNQYERYHSINARAYSKFKTLEVRLHHGSVNDKEILNWTKLLTTVAEHESVSSIKEFKIPRSISLSRLKKTA